MNFSVKFMNFAVKFMNFNPPAGHVVKAKTVRLRSRNAIIMFMNLKFRELYRS